MLPCSSLREALAAWQADTVVVDGNIITSQGPATALPFALKLVELLFGQERSDEISKEMLLKR